MSRRKIFRDPSTTAWALLCTLGIPLLVQAQSTVTAQQIMEKVDAQRKSTTIATLMTMTVYPDASNHSGRREFSMRSFGRDDDRFIEFVSPQSIRGLRILDAGGATRVYFPSTGRIRNISGRSRSGSVGGAGSDFSYEDMGGGSLVDTYKDFTLEGKNNGVYRVLAVPRERESSYSRVTFHVDAETFTAMRVDYYISADTPAKTLMVDEVRTIDSRNVAMRMSMHNHERNSKTVIALEDVAFDLDIDERHFHPNRFSR